MIDISVSNLIKEFEVGAPVLNGLTFQVDTGERVGILGRNGAGKTTLFKILTGEMDYDDGEIMIASGKRVGLISQIPVYPSGYTVEDVLETAFERIHLIELQIAELEKIMTSDPSGEVMRKYDRLTSQMIACDGYDTLTRKNKVANGLSLDSEIRARLFEDLSGGEKTRVNLARLILEDTDILLLDEPTNHLDLHATEWLEEYLDTFKGTVLAISHDRYFLDRAMKRIIELKDGKADFYSGNYSFFVKERQARYLERLKEYEKEQAKIAQLQEAADKLHLWAFMGNDKLHKRAFSMEKRMEKMQTTEKPTLEKKMEAKFGQREFHGDEVITIKHLGKGFEGKSLFNDINAEIRGGERIALIGDNGTGKSTLLKLIMKEEVPDSGKIKIGPSVKIGYLPQIVSFDHPERNMVDTLIYEMNCTPQTARNRLAAFQFQGEDVFKSVSTLSGGERSRLKLCMLMNDDINLLILDEPTNHLDVASREWIEEAVEQFGGNLLFVSHDRYFINRFAERIWELKENQLEDYKGDFDQYRAYCEQKQLAAKPEPIAVKEKKEKPKRTGGTKQLEKQLNTLERNIAKMEEDISAYLMQEEECSSDYQKLQEIYEKRTALETDLSKLYEQWEEISAALEEMGK